MREVCLQMPAHLLWPRQLTFAALPVFSCLHASGLYVRHGVETWRTDASHGLGLIGKSKGCSSEMRFMTLPARLQLSCAACSLVLLCTLTPGCAVPCDAVPCGCPMWALSVARSSKSTGFCCAVQGHGHEQPLPCL